MEKIKGHLSYFYMIIDFILIKNIKEKLTEWYILIYYLHKKSLNICETLQYYSQDINY